jgi:polysaccharide export outer membrane protein
LRRVEKPLFPNALASVIISAYEIAAQSRTAQGNMFLRIRDLAFVASCVIFTSAAADAQLAPSAANDRYRIGFRDVVNVQVFKHPELTQSVPVSPNGTISLFKLDKPMLAVCKTETELANDIAAELKRTWLVNPVVSVSVPTPQSQSVAVIGAVEKPQTYFLNRRVQLLELLAMAGGPNKEAGTRMIVARSGSSSVCRETGAPAEEETVAITDLKVRDVLQGKTTFWIQPGDVVSVLDADIVYVYGNVNRQGAYKTREPITLTQAIASAEGLKGSVKKDKIRVLRGVEGANAREELIFNLNDIEKRKAPDPFLQPNDIVAVSEDKAKSILMGFVDSIKGTIPNAVYRIP